MNKFFTAAAVTAGLLIQSTVFAGTNAVNNVSVGTNYGTGALRDARNNSGSTERISCYLGAYVTTIGNTVSNNYIQCSATAANGASYYCYVYSPPQTWVQLVSALNETSWIYFYGDNAHHCQGLNSSQDSSNL